MDLLVPLRAVHIGACAPVPVSCAFDLAVLRRGAEATADTARRWLRAQLLVGLLLGLLTWVAWLVAVAIRMSGLPPAQVLAGPVVATVGAQTPFGHVWVVRTATLLLLAAVTLMPGRDRTGRREPWRRAVVAVSSVVLVATLAWTGHAAAAGGAQPLWDGLHACAASLWLGMLPPLFLVARRAWATRDGHWLQFAGEAARRFATPGTVAVLILALSGVLNAATTIQSWEALRGTAYGQLVLAKIALFVVMLGLAATNRVVLTPRIRAAF